MRNVYKTTAILIFGISLISAQGVEGHPGQDYPFYYQEREYGRDQAYDGQGDVVSYHPGYGEGQHHGRHGRIARKPAMDRHSFMTMHNGRLFKVHDCVYFVSRHGRWISTAAPAGLRVMRLPDGARSLRTRRGVLYEFRGTFYTEARHGLGYVVIEAPQIGRGRGW